MDCSRMTDAPVETTRQVQLWGGAVICQLPTRFQDIRSENQHGFLRVVKFPLNSTVREVPDTQEVFSHPETDQSFLFELLEMENVSDEKSSEYDYAWCILSSSGATSLIGFISKKWVNTMRLQNAFYRVVL